MTTKAAGAPDQNYEVTPLELFFDLVFAFAASQLSHHLLEHPSWGGAAETAVLLLAVFAVWFYTSFAATMIPVDQPRTRVMILTTVVLSLFLNAAITRAFTTAAWLFVTLLLLIQLGRTVWTILNAPSAVFREHFVRALIWLLITAPLWMVGAAVSPGPRLVWWTMAASIDLVATWLAHPLPGRTLHSANVDFEGGHMLERCRQFLLIALGEMVFTTGTAIAEAPMTLMSATTGTAAFVAAIALWALGFGRAGRLAVRQVETTRDPVHASHYAADATLLTVAGLIAIAVGNETAIARPHEHGTPGLSLLLFGGPAFFLLAQGWYLWALPRASPKHFNWQAVRRCSLRAASRCCCRRTWRSCWSA